MIWYMFISHFCSIYIYTYIYTYLNLCIFLIFPICLSPVLVLLGLTGTSPWPGIRKPGGVSDASGALGCPERPKARGKTEKVSKKNPGNGGFYPIPSFFGRWQSISMWSDMIHRWGRHVFPARSQVKAWHWPVPWRTGTGPSAWRCGWWLKFIDCGYAVRYIYIYIYILCIYIYIYILIKERLYCCWFGWWLADG